MSLLLNALKKAEEGEQKPQDSGEATAAASESAAETSAPAAEAAAPAGVPPVAAEPAATEPAAAPVDFDSIVEEEAPAAGAADEDEKKKLVEAARVFGAGEDEGDEPGAIGGLFSSKLVLSLLGVVVVGGGGYFVLATGVLGIDLRSIEVMIGLDDPAVQVAQQATEQVVELQVADDVVLLPVPKVDVQSEVDFAALRLPSASQSARGSANYIRQVAFLTGFDVNKERTRSVDEQRELLLDLEIDADGGSANLDTEAEVAAEGEDPRSQFEVQTAEASREAKLALDAETLSDQNQSLEIAMRQNGELVQQPEESSEATADVAQPETPSGAKVTQSTPMEVKPSKEGLERASMIAQARSLYQQGNYLQAEAVYRSVLLQSPRNLDALRGVAQIEIVTGRYRAAVSTYLDLLNYYPNDPVAVAELTNLRTDKGNFYEIEQALKGMLGKRVEADSRLYFSLGNLYAQNGRLLKAQQAYFDAFSRETGNPDYAYNLAVVLDYLNKPELALLYYREALGLAKGVLVGFNRAEVEARIKDLN